MKKLSFFLMAMLFSVMSFAETYTHTFSSGQLSNGTVTLSKIKWTSTIAGSTYFGWDTNKGIQIGKSKEPATAYTLSSSAFADKMITNITVNASMASSGAAKLQVSVGGVSYIKSTSLTTSAKDYTGAGTSSGDVVISFTNTAKAFYIKSISITYTEASAGQGMILVDQTDVDFGKVTKTKTITVTGQNLNSAINAELQDGSNFSVEGTLTAEGGELTVNYIATEVGKHTDVLVLTSDDVTTEVALVGEVLNLEGAGTKENPYTVADILALNVTDQTKAWVQGYIIGALNSDNSNKLETTGTTVPSNIVLASTADATTNYIPVALPSGDARNALNLSANPTNLGIKVAVYGTLELYFSKAGVKNVSDYVILTAPVVNHTINVSANPVEAGTVTGGGKYEHGAEATLTATAAEGYEFTCWTSGEDTVSTANPYKFTVTADVTLVANFKEAAPTYDLELVAKDLYSASNEVMTHFEGSNSLNPDMTISVTLFASKYGTYTSTGAEEDEFNAFYAGSQILGELTYSYSDELKSDLVVIIGTITDEEETSTIKVTMYEEYLEPTDVVVLNNLQKNVQKMGWMSNLMLFNAANDTIITISGCDGTYGKYTAWGTFGADELEGKGEWKNDGENDVFVGVLYNADKTKVFQVTATTPAEKIKEYTYELADVSFTLSEVSNTLIIEAYAEEPEPVQVYLELAGWTPEQTIYAVGEMYGSIANMDNIEGADVANLTYEVESYLEGKELTITAQVEDAAGNTYLLILTGEYDSTTTALDNLNTTVAPVKMIENGQLIIINNGVKYNAQGQVIK